MSTVPQWKLTSKNNDTQSNLMLHYFQRIPYTMISIYLHCFWEKQSQDETRSEWSVSLRFRMFPVWHLFNLVDSFLKCTFCRPQLIWANLCCFCHRRQRAAMSHVDIMQTHVPVSKGRILFGWVFHDVRCVVSNSCISPWKPNLKAVLSGFSFLADDDPI